MIYPTNKGLDLLTKAYGITVRDYTDLCDNKGIATRYTENREAWEGKLDLWGDDTSCGPKSHAVSWRRRILWLDREEEIKAEWLHEIAHLVISPPWEERPETAKEMSAIFPWERTVAIYFYLKKIWTAKDLKEFHEAQDAYTASNDGYEWDACTNHSKKSYFACVHKTLKMANLIDDKYRPTFQSPTWTDEVHKHWNAPDGLLRSRQE